MRPASRLSILLCLVALAAASGSTPTRPPPVPDDLAEVIEVLRDGGTVVFLRHGATDTTIPAGGDDHRQPCARQRNLTRRGRAESAAFGAALREQRVPVSEVFASPYCRTAETARLAYDGVRIDERLLPAGAGPAGQRQREEVRRLLLRPPTDGNRLLVGHSSTMSELLGVDLEEGEAAVIAPKPGYGWRLVGRLPPGGWAVSPAGG